MHGLLRRSLRAVLLLCLGSSCGSSSEPDTQPPFNVRITNVTEGELISGSRSLQATAEDDSGRVARMEFRVDRTLLCTDSTTRGSGALFGCTWKSGTTPEGSYQLLATAYDAAGNAAHSAPVSFNIPPPPPNQSPMIASVKATPDTFDEGASTTLAVEASDPDGDALTYSWTQTPATPAGRFSNSSAGPTWTAPALTDDMTFTLQVTVSDGKGGEAQSSVEVSVKNLPENHPPTIASVTATPDTLGEGTSTTLTVVADDLDGDTLTYSWTQTTPGTPKGTFSDSSAASPTWTAPELTSDQTFTLQLTVSDGRGGTAQLSVDVSVTNQNHPPDVTAITAPTTVVTAGATVNLSVSASDKDGDPLTYSWKTIPSDAGLFSSGETTPTAKWRSGDISAEALVKLQVTVSDGKAPVTREVDVRVTVPTYAQIQPIWDARCTTCHNASSASGGLNLVAGSSYAALVDVRGTGPDCAVDYPYRVEPGLPTASLLVQKISGTACGTRMPMSDATYFDNNPGLLTRIRSWILAGARND